MSFNFSDRDYISRNGRQSQIHSEHAIFSSIKRGSFLNLKASPKRMETKALIVALSWIGYGSVIGGILLNLSNFKSDILFWVGMVFMVLRVAAFVVKRWQAYKREEIEQLILKKKAEDSEE